MSYPIWKKLPIFSVMKFFQARLNNTCFYSFLAIAIWAFFFRDFIFAQLPFSSDAGAYNWQIRSYIESLLKGIYPVWSWEHQAPNEFFLRRFDSFNPIFSLLMIFKVLRVPWEQAYRLFLPLYYVLSLAGFYLLSKRILGDKFIAFVAVLLLGFSSLGTRIIDSYIIFMFTAMVWFFYFLIAFTKEPQRKYFLGIIFCLMILVTTYIPFYFFVIFLFFVLSFLVVYFSEAKLVLKSYLDFIRRNKVFVSVCLLLVGLTLVVPILFYQESGKGEFVLPMRNHGMEDDDKKHVLMVGMQTISDWGIAEDLLFSSYFLSSRLQQFQSAIFYVPLFTFILFLCGIITSMNRKLWLLALWGLTLLIINLPYGTPIYEFLYEHVFIFRYFRNLHFFLWVILLPIFILFVAEQFRQLWALQPKTRKERAWLAVFLLAVHLGLALFLYFNGNRICSSYIVIALSLILFCIRFFPGENIRKSIGLLPFLFIIVVEPFEVYRYFIKNTQSARVESVSAGSVVAKEMLADQGQGSQAKAPQMTDLDKGLRRLTYYRMTWHNLLAENISPTVLEKYLYADPRFLVYDRVEVIDDRKVDFEKIAQNFWEEKNIAFLAQDGRPYTPPAQTHGESYPEKRLAIPGWERKEKELQVLKVNSNSITLKTNFPRQQFLVYNDSFHSGWQAFINGKRTDVWRANVAFKGLWVPAGENEVYLRYGTKARYWFNVFMLGLFYFVFIVLLRWNFRRSSRE